MSANHCTDEALLNHLYGLRNADEHLESCAGCRDRAQQIERLHLNATRPPDIPEELLAAQRRSIYQRLGSPAQGWHPLRWALPVLAMLAVIIGLTISSGRQPAHTKDDQFYAEIAALDQNPAPRAVQPIEAMVHDDIEE